MAPYIFGLFSGFFWGFSFLVPKWLVGVPSSAIAWGRFAVFGVLSGFFLIQNLARRKSTRGRLTRRDWGKILALSVIGFSGYYFVLVRAIQLTGNLYSNSRRWAFAAHDFTCRSAVEGPVVFPRNLFFPMVMILGGIYLIAWEGGSSLQFSWEGFLCSWICLFSWTGYAIWNARETKRIASDQIGHWTAGLGICAGLTSTALTAIVQREAIFEAWKSGLILPEWFNHWVVGALILGVFSSGFAMYFWNKASQKLPAEILGLLIVSETVFGVLFGWLYEWRLPHVGEAVATGLCISGVVLSIRRLQASSAKAASE